MSIPLCGPQNKGMQDDFPVDLYRAATGGGSWGWLHPHIPSQAGGSSALGNGSEAAQRRDTGDTVAADDRSDGAAVAGMQASCHGPH